jgi:uncharacterized membrane protein HdeD (DUF308 family)
MKLKKLVRKKRFYERDFWKKSRPIRIGIYMLIIGFIGYIESKILGYKAINYWGGNILAPAVLAILVGVFFIIMGIIKLINNKRLPFGLKSSNHL